MQDKGNMARCAIGDRKMKITIKHIEETFEKFKIELMEKFPYVQEVVLSGGIMEKGVTKHDIDIAVKVNQNDIYIYDLARFIIEFSYSFPLPLDVNIINVEGVYIYKINNTQILEAYTDIDGTMWYEHL